MKTPVLFLAAGAAIAVLTGCDTMQSQPTAPVPKTLTYQLPVLTPVEPDKQTQEQDGVRIAVEPYSYAAKEHTRKMYRLVQSLMVMNEQYPAEVCETPFVTVEPKDLRFKIKVNNQLERTLRLAGSVISFQVAGKNVAVSRANQDEFLNGIILPRRDGEFEIVGPKFADLPDNSTIAFLLYDVVTATDAAGNPTKRSNFEFIYTFKHEAKELSAQSVTRRITLSKPAAQALYRRTGGSYTQWAQLPELDRIGGAEPSSLSTDPPAPTITKGDGKDSTIATSSTTGLSGRWEKSGPIQGWNNFNNLGSYRVLDFLPDNTVNVTLGVRGGPGGGSSILAYKIVDEKRINIGGLLWGFKLNGEELTLISDENLQVKFHKAQ